MTLGELAGDVILIGGAVYVVDKITGKKKRVRRKQSLIPQTIGKPVGHKKRGKKRAAKK